jgi:hypothetical protein
MRCLAVRRRLSSYRDGDLAPADMGTVGAHLKSCAACRRRWQSLRQALDLLADVPRVSPPETIASRVQNHLEVASRGPGLALLFRPAWKARPLILPSLVPAALALVSVLAGALALDQNARPLTPAAVQARGDGWQVHLPPSGTEGNPLFPSTGVGVPQIRSRVAVPDDVVATGEGSFFIETVVARDGSVADVTLLDGDKHQAQPYVEALRGERFEPVRLRGRPVAVSLYRLISRMEVRPPHT